jgi:hypothetical protein
VFPFSFADRFSGAVVHLTTNGKSHVIRRLTTFELQITKRQNARIRKLTQAFQQKACAKISQ